MTFSPALKTLRTDERGRINIGSVVSGAKGKPYTAAVDHNGRILLEPAGPTGLATGSDAAQARRDRAVEHG